MPPTAVASGLDSWQLPYSPCRQKTHFPQAMLNGTRTWSPTFRFSTPSPSSSTTPVNSWPNVIPTRVSGTDPLYRCRSDPQMHDRVTLTMASRGCRISGTGLWSMRTRRGPRYFMAIMKVVPFLFGLCYLLRRAYGLCPAPAVAGLGAPAGRAAVLPAPTLIPKQAREEAARLGLDCLDQGRDDDRGRQQHKRSVAREAQEPQGERRLWRGPGRGLVARANGRGSVPRAGRRARPKQGRGHRVEGGASEQDVLGARQTLRPQLRVVPHAAQPPPEQRREHGGEVRRLEARPGLVQDPPPLLLVADADHRGVQGDLPEQRPAEPSGETEIVSHLRGGRERAHRAISFRLFGFVSSPPKPF